MSDTQQNKIVLVLANNDIGLYKFRKELLQELMNRGNEVHVALPYGKLVEKLVEMGCIFHETPIERRGMNPLKDASLFFRYRKLVKDINPDLVITYTIKPNIYGGLAARFAKKRYAVNITGLGSAFQKESILKQVLILMYRVALKKVKVVFFENADNQKTFLESKIINEERTCVLNGAGVNLEEYPFTPYPEDNGEIRFLFIGRIMREKGVDELFEVAKQIRKEYPNVFFDIVGPMEDDYSEIVNELVNAKVINYYGYQEDVRPFIARSHCVVLPSHHEGMSNTLLEAGAMGRPLITSNIPGCKEITINMLNGFTHEPKQPDDLHKAITTFIKLPFEVKTRYANNSYTLVSCEFEKMRIITKVYGKLL
jgi:glycosyltransferase involved in cell wall biosynthesis